MIPPTFQFPSHIQNNPRNTWGAYRPCIYAVVFGSLGFPIDLFIYLFKIIIKLLFFIFSYKEYE